MQVVTSILRNKSVGVTVFKTESLTGGEMKFYELPRFIGSTDMGKVHDALQTQLFVGVESEEGFEQIPSDKIESKIAEYMKTDGWEQCDLV